MKTKFTATLKKISNHKNIPKNKDYVLLIIEDGKENSKYIPAVSLTVRKDIAEYIKRLIDSDQT